MKPFLLSIFILFIFSLSVNAQVDKDSITNYANNGNNTSVIKIKTNLKFLNLANMPTISLEGFSYIQNAILDLKLSYYVNNGSFIKAAVSTSGAFNPRITLAAETGKVVIIIDTLTNGLRFKVGAFSKGNSGDKDSNFVNWTVVTEDLAADAQAVTPVAYSNRFSIARVGDSVIFTNDSKVGIGTLSPRTTFDVGSTSPGYVSVLGRNVAGNSNGMGTFLGVKNFPNASNAPMFGVGMVFNNTQNAMILFHRSSGNAGGFLSFATDSVEKMRLDANGNLCIGCTDANIYKLAVNGNVRAKKVVVQENGWPDFVFDKSYILPDLNRLEKYIEKNKHLPGISSQNTIINNGLDLSEFSFGITKIVEEQTLYIIKQSKEIDKLKSSYNDLEERLKMLESKLR